MHALILAGGSGTRFWPLSRRTFPKQLLALEGDTSLLQDTVSRLAPLIKPQNVWICTTARLATAVREQLPEVPTSQILAEPEGRNTAPAIGWSLQTMPEDVRQGVVAVLPADHRFADADGLRQALRRAAAAVERDDRVMTLGVEPRWPETGYGYLELGEVLDAETGLRKVDRFREKPELADAKVYAASGRHLWNAGIFVFRGTTLLGHLETFEPEIASGLAEISAAPHQTVELYALLPSVSIDYAVMERLDDIAALPLDCGWSDLGSWEALAEVLPRDAADNRCRGDVIAIEAEDNLLFADQGTIAVLGIRDLVVVRTEETVLVIPRERSQDVRQIVENLRQSRRDDLL